MAISEEDIFLTRNRLLEALAFPIPDNELKKLILDTIHVLESAAYQIKDHLEETLDRYI